MRVDPKNWIFLVISAFLGEKESRLSVEYSEGMVGKGFVASVNFLEDLLFRTGEKADDSRALQASSVTEIIVNVFQSSG